MLSDPPRKISAKPIMPAIGVKNSWGDIPAA